MATKSLICLGTGWTGGYEVGVSFNISSFSFETTTGISLSNGY